MRIASRLCKQSDLGIGDYLYGGRLLEMMGELGAVYAMKLTGEAHLVGYRFDEVVLRSPVRAGEIIDFYGEKPAARTHSVSFDFRAEVNGRAILSARCTYVAIDETGAKKALRLLDTIL